jgi:hypothetical protein
MKQIVRLFAGTVITVFALACASGVAVAQDKGKDAKAAPAPKTEKGKAMRTVLAENDKVLVLEIRQKAGEENTPSSKSTRVVRALSSATILRTYADGKTETKAWKAGEVEIQLPGPEYKTKNVGKTEFRIYAVVLK